MGRKSNAEIVKNDTGVDKPVPIKKQLAERLRYDTKIVRFKGATFIQDGGKFTDMSSDRFAEACYNLFGDALTKSRISDLEHLFRTTAPDLSHRAHLIAFGNRVWDTKKLEWSETPAEDCVYRIPYEPKETEGRLPFIMDLACGDEGVYDDIMQSVAPLLMDKKPTGVIWYLGQGANGKSTLVHLLYKIYDTYLTELTVKQLEDERDTPQLNGKLGNVCKESSEGFIEDTRTYKSIGTHEGFSVHKFHSQDMVTIEGNVHHIFSANNIPTFGDKSYGARRRTLVIPFNARFKPDETFEDRTFTKEFIETFLAEMIKYALKIKKQNYEYRFSETTAMMKEKYDTEANTAQTYVDELVADNVLGFLSYRNVEMDYDNWCGDHGYKPSTRNVLRRAFEDKGFKRKSARKSDGSVTKMYLMIGQSYTSMTQVGGNRLGMFRPGDLEAKVIESMDEQEQTELLGNW